MVGRETEKKKRPELDTWWFLLLGIHSSPLLVKSPPSTPIPPSGTKSQSTWVCALGLSNQCIPSSGHSDSLTLDTSMVWNNDSQVQGVCQGWGALSTNIKLWGSLMKPEKKVNSKQHRELKRDRSPWHCLSPWISLDSHSSPDLISYISQ